MINHLMTFLQRRSQANDMNRTDREQIANVLEAFHNRIHYLEKELELIRTGGRD